MAAASNAYAAAPIITVGAGHTAHVTVTLSGSTVEPGEEVQTSDPESVWVRLNPVTSGTLLVAAEGPLTLTLGIAAPSVSDWQPGERSAHVYNSSTGRFERASLRVQVDETLGYALQVQGYEPGASGTLDFTFGEVRDGAGLVLDETLPAEYGITDRPGWVYSDVIPGEWREYELFGDGWSLLSTAGHNLGGPPFGSGAFRPFDPTGISQAAWGGGGNGSGFPAPRDPIPGMQEGPAISGGGDPGFGVGSSWSGANWHNTYNTPGTADTWEIVQVSETHVLFDASVAYRRARTDFRARIAQRFTFDGVSYSPQLVQWQERSKYETRVTWLPGGSGGRLYLADRTGAPVDEFRTWIPYLPDKAGLLPFPGDSFDGMRINHELRGYLLAQTDRVVDKPTVGPGAGGPIGGVTLSHASGNLHGVLRVYVPAHRLAHFLGTELPLRQRQRQDGLAISAPRGYARNRPKSKQESVRAGWEGTYL